LLPLQASSGVRDCGHLDPGTACIVQRSLASPARGVSRQLGSVPARTLGDCASQTADACRPPALRSSSHSIFDNAPARSAVGINRGLLESPRTNLFSFRQAGRSFTNRRSHNRNPPCERFDCVRSF